MPGIVCPAALICKRLEDPLVKLSILLLRRYSIRWPPEPAALNCNFGSPEDVVSIISVLSAPATVESIAPATFKVPVTSTPPLASKLPAISTVPSEAIFNLSTPFVESLIPKTPSAFLTEKSLLLFVSTSSMVGPPLDIVIFPVEFTAVSYTHLTLPTTPYV